MDFTQLRPVNPMRWIEIKGMELAHLANNRPNGTCKIEDCFSSIYFCPDIFTSCLDVHDSIVIEFFKEYSRKIPCVKTSHKSTRLTFKFKRLRVKLLEAGSC